MFRVRVDRLDAVHDRSTYDGDVGEIDVGRSCRKQVDVKGVVASGVYIAGDRWNKPANVCWAARTVEPFASYVIASRRKWIRIEERFAVQGDARNGAVVKGTLQHI